MRIPPNLKYFLVSLLILGLIVAGVIYLPQLVPNIGKTLITIACVSMGLLVFFTLFKPMFGFLYARADGLFAVYTDQSDKGFHVFAYHINGGGEYGPSTRDVQHYFILLEKGRIFYKCIYSHAMESVAGRSGWSGFDSFEKTILPLPSLQKSLQKFSAKTDLQLQLAEAITLSGDHTCRFEINNKWVKLKKFKQLMDEGIQITCTDKTTNRLDWKKKI